MKKLFIGIAGPSSCGKTTITRHIEEKIPHTSVVLIKQDHYYKNQNHLSMAERLEVNYDHPNSIDMDLLVTHLKMLKEGKDIPYPTYDFTNHTRADKVMIIKSAPIIVLEGIFALQDQAILDLLDIKIYLDADPDICFIRRLERDINERGRTMEQVISQYLKTVKPMQEQFVEPTKKNADFIIPNLVHNPVAIKLITDTIAMHLHS